MEYRPSSSEEESEGDMENEEQDEEDTFDEVIVKVSSGDAVAILVCHVL